MQFWLTYWIVVAAITSFDAWGAVAGQDLDVRVRVVPCISENLISFGHSSICFFFSGVFGLEASDEQNLFRLVNDWMR